MGSLSTGAICVVPERRSEREALSDDVSEGRLGSRSCLGGVFGDRGDRCPVRANSRLLYTRALERTATAQLRAGPAGQQARRPGQPGRDHRERLRGPRSWRGRCWPGLVASATGGGGPAGRRGGVLPVTPRAAPLGGIGRRDPLGPAAGPPLTCRGPRRTRPRRRCRPDPGPDGVPTVVEGIDLDSQVSV